MPRTRRWGLVAFVLGILATIQTLIVNTMGFIDADTGSAFGCGHQWLTCNGQWIPTAWALTTLIEFSHRVGVPILTMLLLAVALLAGIRYRKWIEIPILAAISLFFVLLEAFLGAMAVVFEEPPAVIATHFGVSLLAFSSVLLLTVNIWRAERVRQASYEEQAALPLRSELPQRGFRLLVWLVLPYIYLEMYLGAFISSTNTGVDFRGIPIPTERINAPHFAFFLDWMHRSSALILVLWILAIFAQALNMRRQRLDLFRGSVIALVFVGLQALSGFYLVASHVTLLAFLSHVTVVTGLFGILCFLAFQTLPSVKRELTDQLTPPGSARDKRSRA